MNPFEFVLGVILLVGVIGLIKHRMTIHAPSPEADTEESKRLREEVGELKERIKVLERIAVDKENALAKEIDALRDR